MTDLVRAPRPSSLVLSLFPGIDLLGRGFEAEGFAVVRGPDLIVGGDIRTFHVPAGRFDGVIAGSPCQDFSRARRKAPTGYGLLMLCEFERLVMESGAAWWLLENVECVPDVKLPGYSHLRIDLDALECGARQRRPRVIQFGHRRGLVPIVTRRARPDKDLSPCAMASDRNGRAGWPEFCERQGLPRDFELPGFTLSAKYRAVGNGVHFLMARTLAAAVRDARALQPGERLCECGCGRIVMGRQRIMATVACRQRVSRANRRGVTARDVTAAPSSLEVTDLAAPAIGTSRRDNPRPTDAGNVTRARPEVTELERPGAAASRGAGA